MRKARSPMRSNCGAVSRRVPGWRNTSATSNGATSSNRATPRAENEQALFARNPRLPHLGLLEYFPDCDFEVRESLRHHDVGCGELECACIPRRAGLAIGNDLFAFHIDDPVLRHAVARIEIQLD